MSKTTKKAEKAKQYLATIIPESGSPFEVEVKEDTDGTITHDGKSWHVSNASVWTSGKQRRIILPEGAAESMHGGLLSGKNYMTAKLFFYYIKMKLLEQLFNLQNRKPWYKSGQTWIIAIAIGLLALIGVWLIIELDTSLDGIRDAMNQWFQAQDAPGSNPEDHKDIAPNGG